MWESPDGGTRIFCVQQSSPANVPLDKAGLETGTTRQIQGTLLQSTQTTLNGIPTYTLAAKGTAQGNAVYLMQRIISFSGTTYKIMAGGNRDVTVDQDVMSVLNSVQILDPNPKAPSLPLLKRLNNPELLGQIGALGLFLLIGVGVFAWLRKPKTKSTQPPPLPPAHPS